MANTDTTIAQSMIMPPYKILLAVGVLPLAWCCA